MDWGGVRQDLESLDGASLGKIGGGLECIIVQLDDVGEGLVGKENMILAVFAGDFLPLSLSSERHFPSFHPCHFRTIQEHT